MLFVRPTLESQLLLYEEAMRLRPAVRAERGKRLLHCCPHVRQLRLLAVAFAAWFSVSLLVLRGDRTGGLLGSQRFKSHVQASRGVRAFLCELNVLSVYICRRFSPALISPQEPWFTRHLLLRAAVLKREARRVYFLHLVREPRNEQVSRFACRVVLD